MSERVISVESASETLGRSGCEREKAGNRCEAWLLRSERHIRSCIRGYRDKPSCRKTEGSTRASTLTCAVTAACGSPVMRTGRMFGVCLMLRDHATGFGMTCCLAGAVHRAGYNGSCGTAQRRDPRR